MVVWEIVFSAGNHGPNGNGAMYCETQTGAKKYIAEVRKHIREERGVCTSDDLPYRLERIKITDRKGLAAALNRAMGYGVT